MMVCPNGTLDGLNQTIGVLQQLQRLLPASATLSDVASLLTCIEAEYGPDALLEDVIQMLVGRHLAGQIARRAAARRSNRVEVVA